MKTIKNNDGNGRAKVKYKTGSDVYLKGWLGGKVGDYSADVYEIENSDHLVVIATTRYNDLRQTQTVISPSQYEEIRDLWDAYDSIPYHRALVKVVGVESI